MHYGNAAGGGFLAATGGALIVGGAQASMATVLIGIVGVVVGCAFLYRFATRAKRVDGADAP